MNQALRPVITVDSTKCVNCHRCVRVCPLKLCNDGSGNSVEVNSEFCLGCGECIKACTHGARSGIDDSEAFFSDLRKGRKIIAISAPSIAASYNYKKFNAFLRSLGVRAVFDVSFGAELTIKSYLEYMKTEKPECVISQPCPVLVDYIELYHPELIPWLAPVDSPMLHTVKMIRHFFPEYKDMKIAAVSPCYAKRHEFDETGLGDYNVTFHSFEQYIQANNIDIEHFQEEEFDGPHAERGVLFSTPGGLLRTAQREMPDISHMTRKIEGQPQIYTYLKSLAEKKQNGIKPQFPLVDCLNCALGCNFGAGTDNNGRDMDDVEIRIEHRADRNIEKMKQLKPAARFFSLFRHKQNGSAYSRLVDTYWVLGLYNRKYQDLSSLYKDSIRMPDEEEIQAIFAKMHKKDEHDILDCRACGYLSCRDMAVAIYNGKNKPENCRHYMTLEIAELLSRMQENINSINTILEKCSSSYSDLDDSSRRGSQSMTDVTAAINKIDSYSTSLLETTAILKKIAARTNLLAINASIESAHAGAAGATFSVVAKEIRTLSENSAKEAVSINKNLDYIRSLISSSVATAGQAQNVFSEVVKLTDQVREHHQGIMQTIEQQRSEADRLIQTISGMNRIN